jgi:Na+-driven multidrug efflux pump
MIWYNSFGLGIFYGLACGLETLVSHAFGKGKYRLCGDYLNKSLAIFVTLYVLLFFLNFYVGSIINIWNPNTSLCMNAQFYCRIIQPALLFNGLYLYLSCIYFKSKIKLILFLNIFYLSFSKKVSLTVSVYIFISFILQLLDFSSI